MASRGLFSLNAMDVRCQVSGVMRQAQGSPCLGEYTRCSIWRGEKNRIAENKRARKAARMIRSDGDGYEAAA